MANISKQKRYAILWLNEQGKTNEEIHSELDVSVEQIEKIINTQTTSPKNSIKNGSEPVSGKATIKDSMITQSAAGKHRVAIMTKQASEISDESIKKNNNQTADTQKTSFIFRPNE